MYYNKIFRVWVFDPFDYFFISAFLASILTRHLKDYLSEEASMERLKNSIIKKSQLIEASNSNSKATKFYSKRLKIQRIYKFIFMPRGGQVDLEYKLADVIKEIVIKLAVFLKNKELKATFLKIIFTQGTLILQLILHTFKINLQYVVVNEVNPQTVVITLCAGGATGFVSSWFSVVTPPTILSVFLLRSLFQQYEHNKEFKKLENKDIQKKITNLVIEAQKQVDNSKKITIESLSWNKDPKIKKAAERLGIFENPPSATGKLNLDLLDADSNKFLEELGIDLKPPFKDRKPPMKGKTVYFRDFIDDGDAKSGLDVIDAEIVEEPIRIREKK